MAKDLPSTIVDLDSSRVKLPEGLKLDGDPQALLSIEQGSGDIFYVKLTSEDLGISELIEMGSPNRSYAESLYTTTLKKIEAGKFRLSYSPTFILKGHTDPRDIEELDD